MRHILLIVAMSLGLAGCAGERLHDQSTTASLQVKKDVQAYRALNDVPVVVHVDVPNQAIVSTAIIDTPVWYAKDHQVQSAGVPFYLLIDNLTKPHNLVVHYSDDLDLSRPVYLNYKNGTVKGALDALAATTGFSYTVDESIIRWSKYQIERFDLSHVGGEYNYQIGSESTNADTGDNVLGSNTSQFHNVSSTDGNLFDEVVNTLQSLVGDNGKVVLSQATSSVIVEATATRMKAARRYIKSLNNALSTQIELAVQVLKFRHANAAESGINWNLVKEAGAGKLLFNGAIASSGAFSTASSTLGTTITNGAWNTSSLLISALQEQGTVSVVTEPRLLTQVNRVAELKVGESQSYIAKTQTSTDESGNTSVSIEPGQVVDGYSLYILSNVDANDQVYLHISSMLSDVLSINKKTVGAVSIETPNVHENAFSQTVVLQSGQTVVANSLKQVVRNAKATSPLDAVKKATYKSGQHVIEETVVLVTPTVIRGLN
jgi:MSHA biogenesis protein MshL